MEADIPMKIIWGVWLVCIHGFEVHLRSNNGVPMAGVSNIQKQTAPNNVVESNE